MGRSQAVSVTSLALLTVITGCQSTGTSEMPASGGPSRAMLAALDRTDVQANVFTTSAQSEVAIDFAPDGNLVAVWSSRRQQRGTYGVYGRLLNGKGQPLSPEVCLNTYTSGHQLAPAVAVADDGTVWAVWSTTEHARDGGAIVARQFDGSLEPISDELLVSDQFVGLQARPSVEVAADGSVLFAWAATYAETAETHVVARIFNARGEAAMQEFAIDPTDGSFDTLPAIARVADDAFAITWARRTPHPKGMQAYGIHATVVDVNGQTVMPACTVSPDDGQVHIEPAIDADRVGNATIAWLASAGDEYMVMTRRLDQSPQVSSAPSRLANVPAGWISGVGIAVSPDGRGLVSYNHKPNADGADLSVFGHVLSADGTVLDGPVPLSGHTAGDQYMQIASNARRLAWNASDQIAIGWHGDAGLGDASAANVTLFAPHDLACPSPDAARLASAESIEEETYPIPPIRQRKIKLPPPAGDDGNAVDFGFNAIDYTGWAPPDPELAVGPDHLVAVTNVDIAFFEKDGTLLHFQALDGAGGFFGDVGGDGFMFDPEALYDPHSGRFFVMANERDGGSYFDLAVSDDSNPEGTWHKYRIRRTVDNDIDSPNMSVDEDIVYLSADFFGPDKYEVVMIEKAPLLTGGAVNLQSHLFTGSGNQSMGMPINYDANPTAGYVIQSSEGTANGITFSEVRIHAFQNQLTSPTLTSVDVAVPTYAYPNQPPQAGTSNRPFLFEPRFWSCMLAGDSLWAVHHVNSSRARVRWYEFEMNGWPDSATPPTLRQWGEIDPPGSSIHTFFPSIAADADGNACIVFARSSPSEFISMCRAVRRHDDPLGEFRPMEFVKESTSPYTGAGRWGDYSHVEPDPATNFRDVFWGHHEWTDNASTWRTWIAEIDTRPPFADITGWEIIFGSHVAGDIEELESSDNDVFIGNSAYGFSAQLANLFRMNVEFNLPNASPTTMDATVESRLNHPGGTAVLRAYRWGNGNFPVRDTWGVGTSTVVNVTNFDTPALFVDANGNVRLQIEFSVIATFTPAGFRCFIDQMKIESD